MMPTVKVSLDNLREGTTVEIPYLGYFPNDGQTHEVDQATWDRFVAQSPVGQTLDEGVDHYEMTTEGQKEVTEAHNALREADMESLEDDYKKDELERLADTRNIDTKGKTKDDLADDIRRSESGREPDDFSSVAQATDEGQEE